MRNGLKRKISALCCIFLLTSEAAPIFSSTRTLLEPDKNIEINENGNGNGDENNNKNNTDIVESTINGNGDENNNKNNTDIVESTINESVNKNIYGVEDLQILKGTEFDPKDGVYVIDKDGNKVNDNIFVSGNVDISKEGTYTLKYTYKEGENTISEEERLINVIEANVFNFYISKENKSEESKIGFSFYVDLNTSKIIVKDQSEELLDKNILKEVYANIKVIDKNNKEKISIDLLGEDTGKSKKLDKLKELTFEIGDYIQLRVTNPKENLSISGKIPGDVITEKVDDKTIIQEDYKDGIDNDDHINNVRFEICKDGIKSVYNKAPEIIGLTDMQEILVDKKSQLEGVEVKDDHDGKISNDKIIITEEKDEENTVIGLKYTVQDSWGRSTEAVRLLEAKREPSTYSTTSQNTLNNNVISVKGIRFGTESSYGDTDTRFKIIFDDSARKIRVINQDGRSMNSRIEGAYFKMTLYDANGNKKKEVTINGNERSNTPKLDELRYQGWSYKHGDLISIWHHEAPVKIKLDGEVQQREGETKIDFTTGLTKQLLETTRFELTSIGLKHTLNKAPVITFPEDKVEGIDALVIKRGETPNLEEGIEVNDDYGVVKLEIGKFDSTILGETTVKYIATDNWGIVTERERKIIVEPKNSLETNIIRVKSSNGNLMFSIGFDEVEKKFVLETEKNDEQLNPENSSTELKIIVYNKLNVKKREFKISGRDTITSNNIQKLNNYKYEEGDYISILPHNPRLVTIDAFIEGVENGLDYAVGVTDLDKWNNVCFQVGNGKLTYNYNDAPEIRGNLEISFVRGQEINVLSGMKVFDDRFGKEIDLTLNNTKVELVSGSKIFLGEQVYEITYTDPWGRSTSVTRKVTITPAKPVESYKIELMGGDNSKPVLSFSYDSINQKFKVLEYNSQHSFVGIGKENAFVMEFYDKTTHKKQSQEIILTAEELIDSKFVNKLESITVDNNWYMKFLYHDHTKLKITASKESGSDITFDSADKMEHTRYEISDTEIKGIYNSAPEIIGADDVSVVYGTEFDARRDISVRDDESDLKITVSPETINTNQLGSQKIIYTVTDSYGRATTKERTVTVVPVYTINEVVYSTSTGQELFAIGINDAATGFTVRLPEVIPAVTEPSNFEFKVFNKEGKKVEELVINSDTEINKELFNKITNLTISPEYSFSVNALDLTRLKVTGRLDKSKEATENPAPVNGISVVEEVEEIKDTNYAELTEKDKDAVENVRFKLTENIVKVIYNKAPVLIIDKGTENIVRNQAVTLEDYNLLDGVSVSDDKEKIDVQSVSITYPSDFNILPDTLEGQIDLINKTGQITYQVKDSWGRFSNTVTRQLTVKSAMEDVNLEFLYVDDKLVTDKQKVALNIGFNLKDGVLDLKEGNSSTFKFNYAEHGAFAIEGKNNELKHAVVFGDDKTFEDENSIFYDPSVYYSNHVTNVVNNIKQKQEELTNSGKKMIEYGDKIILRIYQASSLYIDGKVLDRQEDYSKGVNLGSILINSEFEVTPAGLKQVYTGPTMNTSNSTQLTLYNIAAGIQSVNIWLDTSNPDNLRLKAEALDTEWFDTLKAPGDYTVRLEVYNADGSDHIKASYGRIRPSDIASHYNDKPVQEDGYLKIIWFDKEKVKNSKLYNLKNHYGFTEEVDYSGDIVDPTYFDDVRFYFTKNGMVPVYNSAPTFDGIDDKSITLLENFDKTQGVKVKDYIDKDISQYNVDGEVNTQTVGENKLTYSATDSWGRKGSYERKVYVKEKIHENHFKVYTNNGEEAFTIDFEPTLTSGDGNDKITVTQLSDKPLDLERATDEVFKVWVYNKNKDEKLSVTLLGRDSASSEKLNSLKNLEYQEGDYIKVWRAQEENATGLAVTGLQIIGDIRGESVDFSDHLNGVDHMKNTIFYIEPAGLRADYNDAAVLNVDDTIVYYYGDESDLLSKVQVSDSNENVVQSNIRVTPATIDTNKIGTTKVMYSYTDSWGRTVSKDVNVVVRSRSYLNKFAIYGNSNNQTDALKFYIGFNTDVNEFEFYNSDNNVVEIANMDLSEIPSDLEMFVYSRFGDVKSHIKWIETDDINKKSQELEKLKSVTIDTLDMIQIISKESSKVKVEGAIVEKTRKYKNGFESEEAMREVRFQVRNQGLTEVRRLLDSQDIFGTLDTLEIKRGDTIDLIADVVVNHPYEVLDEIKVTGFDMGSDNFKAGIHTLTYSVTDSWGVTFTKERQVKVTPYNKLEEVKIKVSDKTNVELITIGFDSIEEHLTYQLNDTSIELNKLKELLSFSTEIPNETKVLKVSVFNQNMDEVTSTSLTKEDILNESEALKEINNISFVNGGFIGIDVYDFASNVLTITGPITNTDGQNTNKDMRHIRYKISEEGLEATYNKEPEVTPKDYIHHFVSQEYDLREGLNIKDEDSLDKISVEFSEYANYTPGKKTVKATVTDSWGLSKELNIDVYVLSYLDNNSITIKAHDGSNLATLGFNSKIGKLTTKYYEENKDKTLLSSGAESSIKISAYNESHDNLVTITLNGNDTVATIKQKIAAAGFEDYNYHYNYFIGFEVIEEAKTLISITEVKKDSEELNDVNYETGVTNIDYFDNVRFQLNPYGLTAIYNNAPVISHAFETEGITEVKSLNPDDYDLLKGVYITDDKDKLDVKSVKIKYNGTDDISSLKLGENELTFTVIDIWGRESSPLTVKLNLKSAMDYINIDFLYAGEFLKPNLDDKAANLTFEMAQNGEGKIKVKNFGNNNDKFKHFDHQYGAFGVYDENNNPIFKGVLGGLADFEPIGGEFQEAKIYKFVSEFKADIEKIQIKYGYKIKIKIYQSPFVYINGVVNNAQEDYAQGAYLSEILNNSTFEITEEGLVQEYEVGKPEAKQNEIVWLSGVAGLKLFTLNVNPESKTLSVTKHSGEPLDTLYKENSELFSIEVFNGKTGERKYGVTAKTRDYADLVVNTFNNQKFEINDYMVIKILPTNRNRMKNMKIYGDVLKPEGKYEDVDFSGEIKDVAYFNESKFYFTENGLYLDHNEAAVFDGLTDIIILEDNKTTEKKYVNLHDGVTVSDDRLQEGEKLEYKIVDANNAPIPNQDKYRPDKLGAHEVFYVTTDNLGRVTREPRFIWLQAPSQISLKNDANLTVQEGDPKLQTEDAVYDYLINLVTVFDQEDDELGKPIAVTKDNISTKFNPNIPGEHPVTYTVQDSDGNVTSETFNINVVRTISVSVPIELPFQVVTNLIQNPDAPESNDPFISGVMKVTNNYGTDVEVYLKSFSKVDSSGELEIVLPTSFSNWDDLTEEETMKYMALGLYNKGGFENAKFDKANPLWLTNEVANKNKRSAKNNYIGRIPKAVYSTETGKFIPNTANLSFTAKHGKNFIGGTTTGKFGLTLEFR